MRDDVLRASSAPSLSWSEILDQIGQHEAADPRCSECEGWGWVAPGMPDSPPRFIDLRECRCVEARLAVRQRNATFQHRVRYSHLRPEDEAKTFQVFDPGLNTPLREAFSIAAEYAEADPVTGWLVLYGPYGCGKTHLALAIANVLLARYIPVFYAVVPNLLDQLRASYDEKSPVSYYELMEQLGAIDVVILDDLGTQNATPWAREKIYQIISNREARSLPTIITTNQPITTLEPRVASRLYTHLYGGEIIEIDAPDYRMRKAKPRQSRARKPDRPS